MILSSTFRSKIQFLIAEGTQTSLQCKPENTFSKNRSGSFCYSKELNGHN